MRLSRFFRRGRSAPLEEAERQRGLTEDERRLLLNRRGSLKRITPGDTGAFRFDPGRRS